MSHRQAGPLPQGSHRKAEGIGGTREMFGMTLENGLRILAWAPLAALLHLTVLFVGRSLLSALPRLRVPDANTEPELAPWHFLLGMAALGLLTLVLTYVALFLPAFTAAMHWIGPLLIVAAVVHATRRRELLPSGLAAWSYLGAYVFLMFFQFLIMPGFSDDTAARNFLIGLPIDYKISLFFAQSLRDGYLLTFGDWLGSDRPPLLSGFVLLFKLPGVPIEQSYLFVGTLVQLLIVPTMFSVMRLAAPREESRTVLFALVIACMVTSPLFLHNISFLWPKILSAAYLLCAVYVMFLSPMRSRLTPVLSGVLLALSFLSHGGSAFAILALGVLYLLRNRTGAGLVYSAVNLGVFLVTYMPWMAFQKLVQPPGDRLLKWHLLDYIPVTDRSFIDIAAEKYRDIGPGDILDRLVASIDKQFVAPYHALSSIADTHSLAALIVSDGFYSTAASAGLLTLPVMAALMLFTRNKSALLVFTAWVACVLSWSLLPFRGAMAVHEGSYIIQVLPWLAIGLALAATGKTGLRNTVLAVLAVQAVLQLALFWEFRWARLLPSNAGLGTLVSINGDIGGTAFDNTNRSGIRVVGTRAAGGDGDTAHVTLSLDDASRIRYITGPDATGQRLVIKAGPETLLDVDGTVYLDWTVLSFPQAERITVSLIDHGTGWGQWSAVQVLEARDCDRC